MSESWKNRIWSLLLVCTFAVVLSVCNNAMDSSSGNSSSSGTAFADGSTVTISSIPSLSFASNQIAISSQTLPTHSATMLCNGFGSSWSFNNCGATDDTDTSNMTSDFYCT